MGLFSKPNPPIGFHHFLGTHSVLCKGPIDYISRIRGEDKTVWQGQTTGGEIFIDAVDAFGGQYDGEGGVLGWLDIEMGAADQQKNRYLQGALGTTKIPAHRGVVSAIQKQMYVGITKYPKPLKYLATRILTREDGEAQWYPEKAPIGIYVPTTTPFWFSLNANDPADCSNVYSPTLGVMLGGAGQPVQKRWLAPTGYWTAWPDDWPEPVEKPWLIRFEVMDDTGIPKFYNFEGATQQEAREKFEAAFPGGVVELLPSSWHQIYLIDPNPSGNSGGLTFSWAETEWRFEGDMNPAHMLRELDTSRYYGMRIPESEIDDAAFNAAADRLFAERMGMGYLWGFDGTESSVNDFANLICRHIDAIHAVSFQTGKLMIKLIRDDYDPENLPIFDGSNVKRVLIAQCTSPHELVNKVTATYWDPALGKTRTVCVSNPAAIANGAPVNASPLDLSGFSNSQLAILGAQRELRALGNQAWTFEIEVTRVGEKVDFGSAVVLNLPNHKAHNLIMRVMDIQIMDADDATVKLVLSQDLYSLPEVPVVVQTPDFEDPDLDPEPADPTIAMELPYWALVQREGQPEVDAALASDPDMGFVGVAAARPEGASGADLAIDNGSGYSVVGSFTFAPVTPLLADLDRMDEIIQVSGELGIFGISVGTLGLLNDEIVACADIDVESDPIEITLLRGVLDSIPAKHQQGDQIIWWSDAYGTDEEQYASGETISAKVLTRTPSSSLALSSATTASVTLASRAARPYLPGKFSINGEYFPVTVVGDLTFAWSHRDRTQQVEADVVGFLDDDIGPEEGTVYNLRIYNELDALIHSEMGTAETEYVYPNTQELLDNGGTAGDENYPSVSCLLHFNGTNGSTTIIDSGPAELTFTVGGTASLTSSNFKFGPTSFSVGNGWARSSEVSGVQFGSGDFTIEAFVYPTSASNDRQIVSYWRVGSLGWCMGMDASRRLYFYYSVNGSTAAFPAGAASLINLNQWNHVAVVRSGSTLTFYVNFAVAGTHSIGTSAIFNSTAPFTVGADGGTANQNFPGLIDELRITKVARTLEEVLAQYPDHAPIGRLNGKLRIELESEIEGVTSFRGYNHTIKRAGFGFNFGEFFGGE